MVSRERGKAREGQVAQRRDREKDEGGLGATLSSVNVSQGSDNEQDGPQRRHHDLSHN